MTRSRSCIVPPRLPYAIHVFVGMIPGVLIPTWFDSSAHLIMLFAGFAVTVALLVLLLSGRARPVVVWFLLGVSLGTLRHSAEGELFWPEDDLRLHLSEWPQSIEARVRGCVSRGARRSRNGWTIIMDLTEWSARGDGWLGVSGKVRVWWQSDRVLPTTADCVEVSGRLLALRPASHRFDLSGGAIRRGVAVTLFVEQGVPLLPLERSRGPFTNIFGVIDRVRLRAERAVVRLLDPREAGWILAVGAGTRSLLEPTDREVMTRAGIAHLLAVSGLHLALFVLSIRRAFEWLLGFSPVLFKWRERRWWGALLTIPLAGWFVVFSGMGVASVRAALFLFALAAGDLLSWRKSAPGAIGVAGTAILLLWPKELFSAGFQLSFAAVTALVFAGTLRSPVGTRARSLAGWFRRKLGTAVLCAIAAALATAPVTAFHFGQVSLSGVAANVIIAPFLAITLVPIAGAALLVGDRWPAIVQLLGEAVRVLVDSAFAVAEPLSRTMGDPQIVGRPSWPELVAYLLVLLAVAALCAFPVLRRDARKLLIVALPVVAIGATFRLAPPSELEVYFLPVGQGDAALVRTPSGHDILIDAGPRIGGYDAGTEVIVPVLRGLGVRCLDLIVVSHSDQDHIGGLSAVAAAYPPREVWWNGRTDRQLRGSPLEEQLLRSGTLVRSISLDSGPFRLGGTRIEVVHPRSPTAAGYLAGLDDNDNSLCLRFVWAGRALLFLGDAELYGEALMLSAPHVDLTADVLKVSHHGSRTSSSDAMIGRVLPRVAVFSVGPGNAFGFPHEEVQERFERFGAVTLRTDRLGLLELRLASQGVFIETLVR